MAEDEPELVYANAAEVTLGAFDIVFDFGFKPPENARLQSTVYNKRVRVVMSLGHAKSMLPIIARLIAEYESKVGPITAPGFDERAKE